MVDNAGIQVGNVVTPLAPALTNTLLKDADPALFAVLDFFQSIMFTHLGARWDAEVVAAGLPELAGHIVMNTMSLDPAYYLAQEQVELPLLAIYRISTDAYVERTRHLAQKVCKWGFDWILPPLSAGQAERLLPFRNALEDVVMDRIERGYDPNYNSGQPVFTDAGIAAFGLVGSGQYTRLAPPSMSQTNATFEELHLKFQVKETFRTMPDAFPAMEGVTATVDGTNHDGTFPAVASQQINNS